MDGFPTLLCGQRWVATVDHTLTLHPRNTTDPPGEAKPPRIKPHNIGEYPPEKLLGNSSAPTNNKTRLHGISTHEAQPEDSVRQAYRRMYCVLECGESESKDGQQIVQSKYPHTWTPREYIRRAPPVGLEHHDNHNSNFTSPTRSPTFLQGHSH